MVHRDKVYMHFYGNLPNKAAPDAGALRMAKSQAFFYALSFFPLGKNALGDTTQTIGWLEESTSVNSKGGLH